MRSCGKQNLMLLSKHVSTLRAAASCPAGTGSQHTTAHAKAQRATARHSRRKRVSQLSQQEELSADQCTTCSHTPHLRATDPAGWGLVRTTDKPVPLLKTCEKPTQSQHTTIGTCHTTAHTRIPHNGSRHSGTRLRHNTPRPDPHPHKESQAKTSACHAGSTPPTPAPHKVHTAGTASLGTKPPPGCTSAARSLSSWMLRRRHSSTGQRHAPPLLLPPRDLTQSSPSSP